jgi:hypothetical protein
LELLFISLKKLLDAVVGHSASKILETTAIPVLPALII